jgi:D-alanyl-D-alanine endopeptidase (penicillin-binding protein 7)
MVFSWLLNLLVFSFFFQAGLPATVNPEAALISRNSAVAVPAITVERSAVLSTNDRFFFWSSRGDEAQPIASITKLMTALVFLENNPGWETVYKITDDDHVTGGRLNLFLGDRVTVKNLFYTSLVASDNGATIALVHASGLSEPDFVKKMNAKARTLGLGNTEFTDPVGLSDQDVSTAREVALLAKAALSHQEIRQATSQADYEFITLDGKEIKVVSTDSLLAASAAGGLQVLGGKTGYTDKAGYCFVGRFRGADGREVISAILNAKSKSERFLESKTLVNWVFDSYQK